MKKILFLVAILFAFHNHISAQTEKYLRVEEALKNPSSSKGLVVAHRGDWRNHPENSLSGIKSCIEMGVDVVELDVRITGDEKIVVIHDKVLDRTTTGTGKVSHLSMFELNQLQLKNGYGYPTEEKLASLEEVLTLTKNKVHVMIDKAYYILPQVWEVVKKVGVEDQVMFEGDVPVAEFIQTYPKLIKEIRYMPRINPDTPDLENYITGYRAYVNVHMFIASFKKEDKKFLEKVKQLEADGVTVMGTATWPETAAGHTDDDALEQPDKNWGWLLKNGFKAICTDRPQALINYLNTKKEP